MRRIARTEVRYGLVRMLSAFASTRKLNFGQPDQHAEFLKHIAAEIDEHKDNKILQYGIRTQAMFAYVIACLGECKIIKEEDAGEAFVLEDVRIPDFRILKQNGEELFVEVKNCHAESKEGSYSIGKAYFQALKRYCDAFGKPLLIAIYWSRWKLWTLLREGDFALEGDDYKTSLASAVQHNGMVLFGDYMIGTVPSLRLVFDSEPTKPAEIGADGVAEFTIGRAALYCGDSEINDKRERQIAWLLMNYGDWVFKECEPKVSDGRLVSLVFEASPEERANHAERFELAGALSTMISREFNERTAREGVITALDVEGEAESVAALIPRDYKGVALPLWRFRIEPQAAAAP